MTHYDIDQHLQRNMYNVHVHVHTCDKQIGYPESSLTKALNHQNLSLIALTTGNYSK